MKPTVAYGFTETSSATAKGAVGIMTSTDTRYHLLFLILWASEVVMEPETLPLVDSHSPWTFSEPGNSWYATADWNCYMPQVQEQHGDAGTYGYSAAILDFGKHKLLHNNQTKPNVKQEETDKRIVVFRTTDADTEFRDRVDKTWIFSSKRFKWTSVNSSALPRCGKGCVTVTLCNNQVFLIGGSMTNSEVGLWNSLITTDGDSGSWSQPRVDNADLFQSFQRYPHPPTLAVVGNSSRCPRDKCQCKESILFFPRTTRWFTILQLQCVIDKKEYVWREIHSKSSLLPLMPLPTSVTSLKPAGYVYVMAQDGLWKYDVMINNWSAVNRSVTPSQLPCGVTYSRVYATDDKYVVYGMSDCTKVLFYEFAQKIWTLTDIQFPQTSFQIMTRILSQQTTIEANQNVFAMRTKSCSSELWEFGQDKNKWGWAKVRHFPLWPETPYRLPATTAIRGDLYMATAATNHFAFNAFAKPQLRFEFWRLRMKTFTWEKIWELQTETCEEDCSDTEMIGTATYFSHTVIVVTGLFQTTSSPKFQVWGFNTTGRSILGFEAAGNTSVVPAARYMYAVAEVRESTFLLFGGTLDSIRNLKWQGISHGLGELPYRLLNDTWIATIAIDLLTVHWTKIDVALDGVDSSNRSPGSRFRHTMVKTTKVIVLYGGRDDSGACLDETWHFDLSKMSWTYVTVNEISEKPKQHGSCFSTGTGLGDNAVFAFSCGPEFSHGCSPQGTQVWLYHPERLFWKLISVSRTALYIATDWRPSVHVWRNYIYLVVHDPTKMVLLYSRLVCPAGFAITPVSEHTTSCAVCNAGFFSRATSNECMSCPDGLTTGGGLSSSASNCTQCIMGYCRHGKCEVTQRDVIQQSVCHCDTGYTGTQCQHPTYFLAGMGVITFCLLVLIVNIVFFRYRRKKKRIEKNLVQHVNELTDAWDINIAEVNLLERVGGGSFGEVFRAYYRDMTVAVKKLRCHEDEQTLREFEREIQFMQTVRHPNIVLFIGAGRQDGHGIPFIVTEFMERGSLRDLLDDIAFDLFPAQKVQFGVDIARAMDFLHSLRPPRIHRDLKCSNVLVSCNLSAKVADFGHGRQMPTEISEKAACESLPEGLTTPLLNSVGLTMRGIGTVRWRAPELSQKTNYTTAVDVFSYGISLWEIWTRQLPFENYRFDYEVHDAVKAGERPVVPESCPADLRCLMNDCWQQEACARPTFSDILRRLTDCLVNI